MPKTRPNRYPKDVKTVATRLRKRYKDFAHYNLKDPFRELVYILCSTMTQEVVYRRVFADLISQAPTPQAIRHISLRQLAKILGPGGLGRNKARQLRRLAIQLESMLAGKTLRLLKSWPDDQIESFLCSLPGVGKKVARCVMLYSYGRQTFPVDTHCWRIARRLGWITANRPDGSCSSRDMDRLQEAIPPALRHSLHVNMVSLGRDVCHPRLPKCSLCALKHLCPRVGV